MITVVLRFCREYRFNRCNLFCCTITQIHELKRENSELQAQLTQKDGKIVELERRLSSQLSNESLERDRLDYGATPGGEQRQVAEPEYNQQKCIDDLSREVHRLSPYVEKVKSLKRKLKDAEDLNERARGIDEQLTQQVLLVSERDAEILKLKGGGTSSGDSRKDLEISRLKALLKKSTGGASGSSDSGLHDTAAVGVGVVSANRRGVVSERHLKSGDTETIRELQREIQKKDAETKKANERLQNFEKMAGNVVKLQQQSREQSEVIAQLRKEREGTGSEVSEWYGGYICRVECKWWMLDIRQ